jgi:hypothetical protein
MSQISRFANRDSAVVSKAPCTLVYGCSKKCPNRATLRHFSSRSAGLASGDGRSASRFIVSRSELTCGGPGAPETEWPRRPPKRPLSGRVMFTISSRRTIRGSAIISFQGACNAPIHSRKNTCALHAPYRIRRTAYRRLTENEHACIFSAKTRRPRTQGLL